jgi:hypothetical protein
VQPAFIELRFNQISQASIHKTIKVLQDNSDFDSVILTNFDWDVDQEYSGKPRNGKLIIWLMSGKPSFTFRFINDWTGTEYYVDLLDEIAQPLILSSEVI